MRYNDLGTVNLRTLFQLQIYVASRHENDLDGYIRKDMKGYLRRDTRYEFRRLFSLPSSWYYNRYSPGETG